MKELDEALSFLVENVDGTTVAAIGGRDGLLIEQYPTHQDDLTVMAAEVTDLLNTASSALNSVEAGEVNEVIITAQRSVVYARILNDDMFCLLVMNPAGNLGKARLYTHQAAEQILGVLV